MLTTPEQPPRFPSGPRLRQARVRAGLSMEYAALRIERTAYSIAGYERGVIEPPLHVLADLAAVYGTTIGAILGEQVVA